MSWLYRLVDWVLGKLHIRLVQDWQDRQGDRP
jgi:hypothetical protein